MYQVGTRTAYRLSMRRLKSWDSIVMNSIPLICGGNVRSMQLKCGYPARDFKRLGIGADWDRPYVTLRPEYEAKQIEVFGEMAKQGHIYKGLKSVYWCTSCETALAEAEIEYAEKKSHTIYVKFPLVDAKGTLPVGVSAEGVYGVISTTTPWTIPANVAIAVHPEFDYAWVECQGEVYLFATVMVAAVAAATKIESYTVLQTGTATLEGVIFDHPFIDRQSPVILGEYVTLEQGTGCVHTAPGHGPDDFEMGIKYGLPIINPVDHAGRFTAEGGIFEGQLVHDADVPMIKELAARGMLLGKGKVAHQYAHCWRCKNPIIYRATEQWFASVDGFRDNALQAIKDVQWIPTSG